MVRMPISEEGKQELREIQKTLRQFQVQTEIEPGTIKDLTQAGAAIDRIQIILVKTAGNFGRLTKVWKKAQRSAALKSEFFQALMSLDKALTEELG